MTKRLQSIDLGKGHGPPFGQARARRVAGADDLALSSKPLDGRSPGDIAATSLESAIDATGNTRLPEPELLTLAEVAKMLRVSERTVRRRIKDGSLRKVTMHGRLVRISLDELRRVTSNSTNIEA